MVAVIHPRSAAVLVLGFLSLVGGRAQAAWTFEVAHAPNDGTSLKLTEPEGMKASAVIAGESKTDTLPTVFTLADQDAFFTVTLTAADGATWSRKIEVKAYHQTTRRVRYAPPTTPPAPAGTPAPPAARRHIGRVVNATHHCDARLRWELRWDFLLGGEVVASKAVMPGKQDNNVEIPAGEYDVRLFVRPAPGRDFQFAETTKLSVSEDGWRVEKGCKK
jgi:hypothetical protein